MRLTRKVAALLLTASTGCFAAGVAHAMLPAAAVSETPRYVLLVGDRVRLTTAEDPLDPLTGTVLRSDSSGITILAQKGGVVPQERTIEWNALTRIEQSEGPATSKTGTYALTGFGVGALAGAGIGAALVHGSEGEAAYGAIAAPMILAILGTFVGGSIGASRIDEEWHTLPIGTRVGLQLGASGPPLAIGVCASF